MSPAADVRPYKMLHWRQMCCSLKDTSHHLCNTLYCQVHSLKLRWSIWPGSIEHMQTNCLGHDDWCLGYYRGGEVAKRIKCHSEDWKKTSREWWDIHRCVQGMRNPDNVCKIPTHAAFSTFAHGVISECMFFMRMVLLSSDQMKLLEGVIHHRFILLVSWKEHHYWVRKGPFFASNQRWGHGHTQPTPDLFTTATISKDLCPFVGEVLNQQQVLDPNLTQKHASSKCKDVCLQMEEKNMMIKTTVESLSPRFSDR